MTILSVWWFAILAQTVGRVVELHNMDQIQSLIDSSIESKSVILMVHVNWCGSCKRTFPQFSKAASSYEGTVFAAIDATDNSEVAEAMKVSAFPALRVLARGSDRLISFSEWIPVPYYYRDARKMVNFLDRVNAPNFSFLETRVELDEKLNIPINGYLQSLIYVGGDIPAGTKLKLQVIKTTHHLFNAYFNYSCNESCAAMVPARSALVAPLVEYPILGQQADLDWIHRNQFPGIWSVEDDMFQFFNDQSVFKVLIAQDPFSPDRNSTIISGIEKCGEKFTGKVSFGIINGNSFREALSDYGIEFTSGQLAVIMFTEAALDFTRFFSDLKIDSLCEDIERATEGNMEIKYRGNWYIGRKLIYLFCGTILVLGIYLYKNRKTKLA